MANIIYFIRIDNGIEVDRGKCSICVGGCGWKKSSVAKFRAIVDSIDNIFYTAMMIVRYDAFILLETVV